VGIQTEHKVLPNKPLHMTYDIYLSYEIATAVSTWVWASNLAAWGYCNRHSDWSGDIPSWESEWFSEDQQHGHDLNRWLLLW